MTISTILANVLLVAGLNANQARVPGTQSSTRRVESCVPGTRYGTFGFSAPFIIDSTRYPSPASGGMSNPRLCGSDSVFLAVWEKETGVVNNTDIYGIRMDAQGRLLDSQPIPVSCGACQKVRPVVAFDGTNFLVVWSDNREPPVGRLHLYGKLVTQAGVVLDSSEFRVCPLDSDQVEPDLCFGAGSYYCVWIDCRQYFRYPYGSRISPSGQVLDSLGVFLQLQFQDHSCYNPAVASDDSAFLVAWHDASYDNIYGTRVTAGGLPLDSVSIVFNDRSHYVSHPSLVFGAGNYFAVWNDDHGVNGARITRQGRNLDTLSIYINSNSIYDRPSAAFAAGAYLAVWSRGDEYPPAIVGGRIATSGLVLDSAIPIDTFGESYRYAPDIRSADGHFLAVWQSDWDRYAIKGARLDSLGQGEPFGIDRNFQNDAQFMPALASVGTGFLTAWYDDRLDAGIYARRITADGARPDSCAIRVHVSEHPMSRPVLAACTSNYLVAWTEYHENRWRVWGKRVSPLGALLDSLPIALCTAYAQISQPGLSSDGSNYLVAVPAGSFLWAIRVTAAGQVPDSLPLVVGRPQSIFGPPMVSFDGTRYWVAWQDAYNSWVWTRFARVNRDGSLQDSTPVTVRAHSGLGYPAAIACGGQVTLLVWSEYVTGSGVDVLGARVRLDRTLLDSVPIPIGFDTPNETDARAAFDGEKLLVVWRRYFYPPCAGARMDENGFLSDPFVLEVRDFSESLALAVNSQGNALLSFDAVPGGLFLRQRVWAALGTWVGIAEPGPGTSQPARLSVTPAIGHGRFTIHCPSQARVVIYDVAGKQVRALHARDRFVVWDGTDEQGRSVAAGVYTVCVQVNGTRQSKRLVRL